MIDGLIVKNVLLTTAKVTEMFYSNAINDEFDYSVSNISKTLFKKKPSLLTKNFIKSKSFRPLIC